MEHNTEMEIGTQIKKYRTEIKMSQEELAERIFVTRQSVSNWENGKNYPDIKSLLLMSALFHVSLDILVKGDLEKMKKEIKEDDIQKFKRDGDVFAVLFFTAIISPIPLIYFLGYIGAAIWVVLMGVTLYYAMRVEKYKKSFDIQTYKEIVAFIEERPLEESEKYCERGKRPYQKVFLAIGAGVITMLVAVLFTLLFHI